LQELEAIVHPVVRDRTDPPAAFPHDSFYAEAVLAPGTVLPLDRDYEERAIYLASGRIDIAGQAFDGGQLLVFNAESNARLMLLGGEPMDGPRHIWWNFVSSSKDRIESAKSD
jgi:redox-sensitive bicupin YhaK (pirin superfamily)